MNDNAPPGQEQQSTVADSARIETAAAAALVSATSHLLGTDDPELAGFFAGFTRYASPEDLLHYSAAEFSALLRRIYSEVKQRRPGQCVVEFSDPATDRELKRGETVLLAVNNDVPFL
jgi:NAD-specific glutamate dehydrogenase